MPRQPYCEVARVGRWTYQITLYRWVGGGSSTGGFMAGFDGPKVIGRRHAERRARRYLRRHLRDLGWAQTPPLIVTC